MKTISYNLGIMLLPIILLFSACSDSCPNTDVASTPVERYEYPRKPVVHTEPVVIQLDSLSFGEAFHWQWRAKDIGDTFWWRGEQYVIRLKDE